MRARTLAAVLAVVLMATMAFGYTEMWTPPYFDNQFLGGTASSAIILPELNVSTAPTNFSVVGETLHMAAHLQSYEFTVSNANGIYNPVVWCLNGAVTLYIGVPIATGSTTLIPVPTAGDSHGIRLPGIWKTFTVYKSGTTDSATATGYFITGASAPNIDYFRLK